LLLGGRLADLLGRRRVMIIGAAVFTAASLACGLAGSAGALIAARAVEGVGAALMAPAALALILVLFPEGAERNKALGAFGAVTGAGAAIGVLAGGMLTTWLSWPWIFFVNLPVGALIVAGARSLLPESRADLGHRRFDAAGAITVTGGLTLLVYAVVTASSHGWASAATIGLLTATGSFTTHLLPGYVLVAAALGLAFVGDFIASSTGVSPADAGVASGLINTSQQIGGAIGLAVTTTVAAARTTALLRAGHPLAVALTGGFHDAFVVTAVLALAAAGVAAIFIRRAGRAARPPASPAPAAVSQAPLPGDDDAQLTSARPAQGDAKTGGRP
jgi:MFS family permease